MGRYVSGGWARGSVWLSLFRFGSFRTGVDSIWLGLTWFGSVLARFGSVSPGLGLRRLGVWLGLGPCWLGSDRFASVWASYWLDVGSGFLAMIRHLHDLAPFWTV